MINDTEEKNNALLQDSAHYDYLLITKIRTASPFKQKLRLSYPFLMTGIACFTLNGSCENIKERPYFITVSLKITAKVNFNHTLFKSRSVMGDSFGSKYCENH